MGEGDEQISWGGRASVILSHKYTHTHTERARKGWRKAGATRRRRERGCVLWKIWIPMGQKGGGDGLSYQAYW